jgi:hypothetical protein
MIDRSHKLLLQRGRSVLSASPLDRRALAENVNMIEKEVAGGFKNRGSTKSTAAAMVRVGPKALSTVVSNS